MKKIQFKIEQIEFIKINIQNESIHNKVCNFCKNDRVAKSEVELSDEEIEIILNELTFLLTDKGLDSFGEVNSYGKFIDEIIGVITNNC
jgi:hypothetical protein